MTGRATLIVRADLRPEAGWGHIRRCLAVVEHLKQFDVRVLSCPGDSLGPLTGSGVEVIKAATGPGTWLAGDLPAGAGLLLDDPTVHAPLVSALAERGHHVAAFDDAELLNQVRLGFLIDYTRDSRKAAAPTFSGPACFPLRSELRALTPAPVAASDRLMVTMGGTDPYALTRPFCRALKASLPKARITAVLGGGCPRDLADDIAADGMDVAYNPPNVGAVFAEARLIVAASGGTAYELAYLGRPTVMISLAPDQDRVARLLAAAGTGTYAGDHKTLSATRVAEVASRLWSDAAALERMSTAGRQTVDGQGAARIAAALTELINPNK